ncbi:MAG TPA: maleylpyruvate isomerase family mycothiol-dependent enzyme [Acidimicrobiales bacterium]|nr:maleylpyruvate isomerase family mycothiol-dependent enzyme [Acidimicrobiales bacterium]
MTQAHDPAVDELRFALAEADAVVPPRHVRQLVQTRALAARPAGIPVGAPEPIDPAEAFQRAVFSLDAVLSSLEPVDWRTPALRGLDVQGLIGHLIGVEHGFRRALESTDDVHAEDDHVVSTDPFADEQRGRDPAETLEAWRDSVRRTRDCLAGIEHGPAAEGRPIALYGLLLPLATWLVVRSFELWTHEEDIRRATGRPLLPPDTASLRLMTTLAIGLVPAGMARTGRTAEGRSARIVLTGAGGGTWQTGLGAPEGERPVEGGAHVRIVADAVDFCRVVANRLAGSDLDADITGDRALAHDILAGVATLALD